ncbi:hypothetical protein A9Q84_09065 [Halobacteriovorax marinus]|uniref:Endonuclease/exonuclease/phosphatase domain-containing protein n=1 Tax=Halobacteriovorax marinus TaxID=97084 RepID=A0A1Y5FBZ3_9BACT|nr:hypothetical protein A9Q84_09065 [Halobacteriovorax marinus]
MKTILISLTLMLCLPCFGKSLELMVYNVENLFDLKHDEGKNDWTFLPEDTKGKKAACAAVKSSYRKKECFDTNWGKDNLEVKLENIEKMVVRNNKLPDILALVEIENENVVKQLAKVIGYKRTAVSNSPDRRGIDLAVVWNESDNLKFLSMKEHTLVGEYFKERPSRNILEVEFLVGKKEKLTVFVNHWPSLSNPTEARLIAANTLAKRTKEILKKNPAQNIMAVGDFNTIDENYPHPFKSVLYKDDLFKDLHSTFKDDRSISWNIKNQMAPGSYFYGRGMTWNLLDRIFFTKNLLNGSGMDLKVDSYKIHSPSFATKTYEYRKKGQYLYGSTIKGAPFRSEHNSTSNSRAGYSDHFPLIVKMNY